MGWQVPRILHTAGHVEDNGEEKPGTQGPPFLCAFECVAKLRLQRLTGGNLTQAPNLASLPPASPSRPAERAAGVAGCFSACWQVLIALQILATMMAKPPDQEAWAGTRCPWEAGA